MPARKNISANVFAYVCKYMYVHTSGYSLVNACEISLHCCYSLLFVALLFYVLLTLLLLLFSLLAFVAIAI